MKIDVRIEVDDDYAISHKLDVLGLEEIVIHQIVRDVEGVQSAVALHNDGFSRLLPDESTRQEH